jgi:oligosaccharide repeat unit polymerase
MSYIIRNMKTKNMFSCLLLFTSIIHLMVQPRYETSRTGIYLTFISVIISTYLYFKHSKKVNYLDFDTIFIIILLIVGYAYPVFLFDTNYPFIFFFGMDFSLDNLVSGTIIYTIGVQSYFLGSLSVKKRNHIFSSNKINTLYLSITVLVLSFLFILVGGYSYFQNMYKNVGQVEVGPVGQVMALLSSFSIVTIASEFYNIKTCNNYKIKKIAIISILTISVIMLIAGNRTFASQLLLPIIVLYAVFKKNIGFIGIVIFVVVSIFAMYFIQLNRSGHSIGLSSDVVFVVKDLVIPARNNYICIEYVDKYGYTYGKNMGGGLIGVIPSLERILVTYFDVNPRTFGSAEIFTDYTLGTSPTVGLGTTIIADIYLSFGVSGIIVLMYLLGYFSKSIYLRAIQLDYYSIIAYAAITSFSVYWVRTTYTHPLRLLLWCLLIAYLNKILTNKRVNQI